MRFIRAFILWLVIFVIAGAIFIWSGTYNVGADSPHWGVTKYLIGEVRERSIDLRSADIKPPALDDPALVKLGAEHYSEMCVGCHLAPGVGHSDLREGLYPKPPNLTRFAPRPAEAFWVIKHGLKMTGMPAWGESHDDHEIWALVAYLQKQPKMGVVEYRQLAGHGAGMGDHGHDHGHGIRSEPARASSSGVASPASSATAPVPASSAGH
ncbi:MAG TPA: cytochrome c [Rhodanobacteraceae bacterium]|jgi:mono/diheme cytochrome c family protein|nr:cytochrome c [Rhodanobacteraceae bacterium]